MRPDIWVQRLKAGMGGYNDSCSLGSGYIYCYMEMDSRNNMQCLGVCGGRTMGQETLYHMDDDGGDDTQI